MSVTDTASLSECEQPLPNHEHDAGRVTLTRTSRIRHHGCTGSGVMLSQYRTWTRSHYRNTNKRYQSVNVTAACRASVTPTRTSQIRRRGCAGSGVMLSQYRTRTRSRSWNANNRYQSVNVTAACRASVTPTRTSQIRRRGCAGSGVMLSQCRTWTRSRSWNANNRYQSTKVTVRLL